MKVEFIPGKEDLLQLQLFIASKSEQIIKTRKRSKWRVPISYAVLGLILAVTTDKVFGIIFLALGVLWFFFYPVYLTKWYVRIYKKNIEENFSNRKDNALFVLNFNDEYVETQSYMGEGKLRIKEILRIDEIRDYCFVKFTSGSSMVIPVCKLPEKDSFIEYLKKMAADNGIPYETDLEWKWK